MLSTVRLGVCWLGMLGCGAALAACGSENALPADSNEEARASEIEGAELDTADDSPSASLGDTDADDDGDVEERPNLETRSSGDIDSVEDGDEYDVANLAPGYAPVEYPEGPYGQIRGTILADEEFLGWRSPIGNEFNLTYAEPIRFSDFYNPTDPGGPELLFINAVTVWCSVCRQEYVDLGEMDTEQWRERGLEIMGVLFEDNNGDPATYLDMINWTRTYGVDFPFVVDPSFKTGVYFDRSATPMNMVVDLRTMQILQVVLGYTPQLLEFIDATLTARGR